MARTRNWAACAAIAFSVVSLETRTAYAGGNLQVAASIEPIHSLVAAVMGERGPPVLLIPPGQSEHSTLLRPSSAEALATADLVFRVARGFELALDKPIDSLAAKKAVIELARAPGIKLLAVRTLDEDHAPDLAPQPGDLYLWADLHLWLDPVLAKAMTAEIVRALSAADPAHAQTYAANGATEARRLDALSAEIGQRLKPVARVPYVVFHDAYQYFEARYPLRQVGVVEINPGQSPSARHLVALRRKIAATGAACVFAEPQFEPKLLGTITEGLPVRVGALDPLGADLTPGPELYFTLLDQLTAALLSCLKH